MTDPDSKTEESDRRVSVVVPCYNRGWYVNRLLHSLTWSALAPDRFEVIVVDDGGADHVELVVEVWRARGLDVRYVRARGPGPIRNCAIARNVGIRAARYPVVLQTDPEMVFATDVLSLVRAELKITNYCCAGQLYSVYREALAELELRGDWLSLGPEDYLELARGGHNIVDNVGTCRGLHAAFAAWRSTMISMGGYDESFLEWGYEDRDMITRLEQGLGLERTFIDDAVAVHLWHPSQRTIQDEALARGRAGRRDIPLALWRFLHQRVRSHYLHDGPVNPGGWGEPTSAAPSGGEFNVSGFPWREHSGGGRVAAEAPVQEAKELFEATVRLGIFYSRNALSGQARRALLAALARPWEEQAASEGSLAEVDPVLRRCGPRAQAYPLFAQALGELWIVEESEGNDESAKAIMHKLENELGRQELAAYYRATMAYRRGEQVEAAARIGSALSGSFPGALSDHLADLSAASAYTLAVEIAMQREDRPEAWRLLIEALSSSDGYVHNELIQLHCCLETLSRDEPERYVIPDSLAEQHSRIVRNVSVSIFAAVWRCIRNGFDCLAIELLRKLISGQVAANEQPLRKAHYHYASALKRRGEHRQARERFEALFSSGYYDSFDTQMQAATHFHFGELLLADGETGPAREQFGLCLRRLPDHGLARERLRRLERS